MEEVGVLMIFVDFYTPCFEEILKWDLICFGIFFLDYMIVSCGRCMRYSMPFLIARKAGSVGEFIYPLVQMLWYCRL